MFNENVGETKEFIIKLDDYQQNKTNTISSKV